VPVIVQAIHLDPTHHTERMAQIALQTVVAVAVVVVVLLLDCQQSVFLVSLVCINNRRGSEKELPMLPRFILND